MAVQGTPWNMSTKIGGRHVWILPHDHVSSVKLVCATSLCACSVSQGVILGSALSPSITSSFTQRLGLSRTQSELSSPRSSDASLTRKNKLWPFSKVSKLYAAVAGRSPHASFMCLVVLHCNICNPPAHTDHAKLL